MILKNFKDTIGIYPNMLSATFCKELISHFEKSTTKRPGETSAGINRDHKNTMDLQITEKKFVDEITTKSNECIDFYVEKFGHTATWNPKQVFGDGTQYPIWQMQRYAKNTGHYKAYHTEENYNKATSNRLFVVMFYLNDVKTGGETLFPYSDIKIKPTRGTYLCWPAGWPWLHAGAIPTSDTKYIVTSWLCANWEN